MDTRDIVGSSWRATASNPYWWGVALLCTLVVDRPLQFLYESWFLRPRKGVFPALEELLPGGGSSRGFFAAALLLALFLLAKALDYLGQLSLIGLTAGASQGRPAGTLEQMRRGLRGMPAYVAAMIPLDLVRYFLLALPFLVWLTWRRFDPGLHAWCQYLLVVLFITCLSLPLYVAAGVYEELAGRALAMDGVSVPRAWAAAWERGRRGKREVFSAWIPTFLADLIAAAFLVAAGFAASYASLLIRGDRGWAGGWRGIISDAVFVLLLLAVKSVLALARVFKSCVWTEAWLSPGMGKEGGHAGERG